MKTLILALALLSPIAVQAALPEACSPNDSSRWKDGSIEQLANGAQNLEHIRASGIYLAADLLCSLDSCVGYVNGIKASGSLQRASDSNRITGFAINQASSAPRIVYSCDNVSAPATESLPPPTGDDPRGRMCYELRREGICSDECGLNAPNCVSAEEAGRLRLCAIQGVHGEDCPKK